MADLASHVTVEILSDAGFDWLLLDTEHAPNELPMVHSQFQAAATGTAHPVVRPAWNDQVIIKRLLDIGTQSLLIPYIETEEEARQAVASTRYPPQGVRGFASQSRASRFARIKDYYARASEEICVLLQVETKLGLENRRDRRSRGGRRSLRRARRSLGRARLSGATGHPEVVKVIDDAVGGSKPAARRLGILTGDVNLAQHFIELGCLFTAVGSDLGVLVNGAEQLAAMFKSQNPSR